jgi:sigma-B regulation protein RsbU (phosphoserine phosphatase)
LEPESGRFTYSSAGHNPAFLAPLKVRGEVRSLRRTGMPLGISEKEEWEQQQVVVTDEMMLVLYTDGITEGINAKQQAYGEERMLKVLRGKRRMSAKQITQALLDSFHDFVGDQPQFDDIALIVLRRLAE